MSKLLKIGIPILVAAVLVLVIGAGLVLAKEKDTSVLNCPYASYDDAYSGCSQCPGGLQYANCPCAGNGGGLGGCRSGGYCAGQGADCYGQCGLTGENDASYQPPCHKSR